MAIKPSSHGIVVANKETGLRYASLDANYDPETERKVRDLKPGESVLSYQPRRPESLGDNDQSEESSGDDPGTAGN